MTSDIAANGLWYVMALALVGSALVARRLPLAQSAKMAALWMAIFGLAALTFMAFQAPLINWIQARRGGNIVPPQGVTGSSDATARMLRIPMSSDGHYWIKALVNGSPARFLIDTGASVTAISVSTAKRSGVELDTLRPPMMMNTANGVTEAQRAVINELNFDGFGVVKLPVVVAAGFGETNVIGMNVLNKLKGWRVESNVMILEPK